MEKETEDRGQNGGMEGLIWMGGERYEGEVEEKHLRCVRHRW